MSHQFALRASPPIYFTACNERATPTIKICMLCPQSSVLERFITSEICLILLLLNVQFEAKFYVFELWGGLIQEICLFLCVEFVMCDGGLGFMYLIKVLLIRLVRAVICSRFRKK